MGTNVKMKIAILISGLSYDYNYNHIIKKNIAIDYIFYYDNIKKYVIDFFSKYYEVDIYISTNNSDKYREVIKLYNPVKSTTNGDTRNERVLRGLELIDPSRYDFVAVTRFDIIFKDEFHMGLFDLNKVNAVSALKKPNIVCDNFYLFSTNLFPLFYSEYMTSLGEIHGHFINSKERTFKWHLMKDEKRWVDDISFYKLRIYDYMIAVINRFENVVGKKYLIAGDTFNIYQNYYSVNKTKNTEFSWYFYFDKERTYDIILYFRCDSVKNIKITDYENMSVSSFYYDAPNKLWQTHNFSYSAKEKSFIIFSFEGVHGVDFKLKVNEIEYPTDVIIAEKNHVRQNNKREKIEPAKPVIKPVIKPVVNPVVTKSIIKNTNIDPQKLIELQKKHPLLRGAEIKSIKSENVAHQTQPTNIVLTQATHQELIKKHPLLNGVTIKSIKTNRTI